MASEQADGEDQAGGSRSESDPSDPPEPGQPNIIDRTADKVDALHRRIPPVAFIHGVIKKYGEDLGGQLAMLLTYRGFFSLFPLLLAFVNVIGLLLDDDPELRDQLIDSALGSLPVVGTEIQGAGQIGGSAVVVVLAILLSLWAGLGLLDMLQEALNTIWGVPRFDRPPFIWRKLRSIPGAVLVGLCLLISGAATIVFTADQTTLRMLAAYLFPFVAAFLCATGLQYLLCRRKVPFVNILPMALAVGVGWTALQRLGGWYVDRFVLNSSDTYGIFVVVFGLLSWVYLLSVMYLLSNEFAVVLMESRWPRSITGRNLTEKDKEAVKEVLSRSIRVRDVSVDVDVPEHPR